MLPVPGSQRHGEHQIIVLTFTPLPHVVAVGVVPLEADRHLEGLQLSRACEGLFVYKTFVFEN